MGVNSNLLFPSSPQTQQFLGPLILQVQPQVDITGENRMKKFTVAVRNAVKVAQLPQFSARSCA